MRMGVPRCPYVTRNVSLTLWANLNSLVRVGKQTQLALGLPRGRLIAPQLRAGYFDRHKLVTVECDGKKYDIFFAFISVPKNLQ